MKKPDLGKMTHQELRSYILVHCHDDRAIEALIKRGNPHRPKYKFPQWGKRNSDTGKFIAVKQDGKPVKVFRVAVDKPSQESQTKRSSSHELSRAKVLVLDEFDKPTQ
jgi:hypothetical protein